ncbi:MAG: glycosyltransferase [Deltaproteobacteria bacterium]|nr:glycosyltransferase [Deltaproteobacteria bacterium]
MTPRVSILLPVFDAGETLPTALASILRQREERWECVVVDDGSTDDSLAIARTWAARDARIRVVARPHEGLVAALNAGASLCRAPLVARMDADDWMHRERLALQCDLLDRAPELDAVGSFVRSFPRASLKDGSRRYEAWLHGLSGPFEIWRDRFVECGVAHPTLVIRRARLAELAYREAGWPEDYDLLLRVLAKGPRVGVVPRRLLGWRNGENRASRRDPRYALDRFTDCRAHYLARDFLGDRRDYVLWGHGQTGRALRRALEREGRRAHTIVEVHPRRLGQTIAGAPVVPPEALAEASSPRLPLIASVAGEVPRAQIRAALEALGYRDGIEFVCAA